MRLRFCHLAVLTTLATFQLTAQLKGQEADSGTRSGLLGRAYAEVQALYYDSPEPPGLVYDSTTGVTGTLNVPVPWTTELLQVLSQDLFVSAGRIDIAGSLPSPGIDGALDALATAAVFWTSLFADVTDDFRPFIQIGIQSVEYELTIVNANPYIRDQVKDKENFEFLVIGNEIDLSDQTAFRAALDCELEDEFRDSMLTAELIHWFGQHVFVRFGFLTDLQAEGFGGVAGGGVAW